jgi:hypothetical protein
VGQRPRKCHLLAGDTSFIRDPFGGDGSGRAFELDRLPGTIVELID